MTAAASWSSISASSRCSSVAYSWWRSLASARARWSDCSRLRENVGISVLLFEPVVRSVPRVTRLRSFPRPCPNARLSFLFHDALQRMLVFACKVHHLRHLVLGDLVRINATFADSVVMDVQHDAGRRLAVLVEEPFQHVHDELHRRVVIIEQKHPVEARPLGLRLGFGDDGGPRVARVALPLA